MSPNKPVYTPTPEQLREAALEVRNGWSLKDELRRQVGRVQGRPRFGPFPDSVFGDAAWSEVRT